MKKLIAVIISLMMCFCFSACSENSKKAEEIYPDASVIKMEKDHAAIDGVEITEYDYTWNVDPSVVHNDVKNAPAEYYTGTKPDTDAAAYIDHEIYYFPALDAGSFKLVNYDGEQEYAYYYSDGENNDYIFATLPKG